MSFMHSGLVNLSVDVLLVSLLEIP